MSLLDFSGNSQSSDYRRFRTPYFRVKIGPEGKDPVELPIEIHKLIQKIEISEFFNRCRFDVVNITFIEGSREPFSKQEGTDTRSIFPIETNSGDNISNSTGMLADLIFSDLGDGKIGITSLNAGEVLSGISSASASISQASSILATNDPEKEIRYEEVETLGKIPEFVFSEKNVLEVTWGYLEDPQNWRKAIGKIGIIKGSFPETGHPTLTVTTFPISAFCDQLTPVEAIDFKTELSFPSIPGIPFNISEAEDMSTADIVRKIGNITGSKVIISDSFDGDKLDADYIRKIPAGKSPHQFLIELARRHHVHYKWILSPADNKPLIVFIKVNEWNRISRLDPKLLTYKGPNSILKSVSIKADVSNITETTAVGIDDKGKLVQVTSQEGKEKAVLFEGETFVPSKPIGENDSEATKNFHKSAGNRTSGYVYYDSEANQVSNLEEKVNSSAACQKLGNVVLEFNTLGYTKLHPGPIHIQGIGKRYSGHYQIQNMSHIIDANGYNCRGIAICEGLGTGGPVPSAPTKGDSSKEKVDEVLFGFEDASSTISTLAGGNITSTAAADEYAQEIGIA